MRYERGLDGLRALAVAAVLCFHAEWGWARGGFLGVSAFFTLSGFLITRLLLAEHDRSGRVALGAFWGRRARRLLPAAFAGVGLAAAYVALVASGEVADRFAGDGLAALLDVANWRFLLQGDGYLATFTQATGASTAASPLLHFWSLAIEEQFYLLFPLVLVGLVHLTRGRRTPLAALLATLAAASFGLGAVLSRDGDVARAYFGTDTRAGELLVGATVAVLVGSRVGRRLGRAAALGAVPVLALAVVAWSRVGHDDVALFRGLLALHALGTAVVLLGAMSPGPVRDFLSIPPLVAIGRASYGVYVYHWPVFLWLDAERTGLDPAPRFVLQLGVTGALATLSYLFLEQPIRHGRAPRLIRGLAAPAWVVAATAVVVAASVAPAPTTVFAPVSAAADRPATATDLRIAALDEQLPQMPAAFAPTGPLEAASRGRRVERVLVVGDSVALTLGRGVERWGAAHDVAVWNLGRRMCGIPRAPILVGTQERDSRECGRWPEIWGAAIEGFDPDLVIVLSPIWDAMPHQAPGWRRMRAVGDRVYDRWLLGEYRAAADVLGARGARIVWLDSPCAEGRPLTSAATALNAVLARLDATRPDVELVSLRDRLCDASGRWAHARDSDGFHFSDPGADLVGGWLLDRLTRR